MSMRLHIFRITTVGKLFAIPLYISLSEFPCFALKFFLLLLFALVSHSLRFLFVHVAQRVSKEGRAKAMQINTAARCERGRGERKSGKCTRESVAFGAEHFSPVLWLLLMFCRVES